MVFCIRPKSARLVSAAYHLAHFSWLGPKTCNPPNPHPSQRSHHLGIPPRVFLRRWPCVKPVAKRLWKLATRVAGNVRREPPSQRDGGISRASQGTRGSGVPVTFRFSSPRVIAALTPIVNTQPPTPTCLRPQRGGGRRPELGNISGNLTLFIVAAFGVNAGAILIAVHSPFESYNLLPGP